MILNLCDVSDFVLVIYEFCFVCLCLCLVVSDLSSFLLSCLYVLFFLALLRLFSQSGEIIK